MARLSKLIRRDIEKLVISEGRFSGQKFKVLPWQQETLEAINDYSILAITMARGNGKTSFVSGLACSCLVPEGALNVNRGQVPLIASSFDQAGLAFDHIKHFLKERMENDNNEEGKLRYPWRTVDNSHQSEIEHVPSSTVLKCRGSDPKRAHGLAPSFAILDEPAKWISGGRDMWSAIKTSKGKQINPKILLIGTRPDTEDHFFSEILNNPTEDVFVLDYKADQEGDAFSMEQVRKANPSYDYLPELRIAIDEDMRSAREGGQDYHTYRALRLNLGTPEVAEKEYIIAYSDWQAIKTENPGKREGPVFLAIDLGDGFSMTAFAAYWALTGRLEVYGAFPATPELHEHGKIDAVGDRYVRMHERGELKIYPGMATNNQRFLSDMFDLYKEYEFGGVSADRYKEKITKQAIVSAQVKGEIEYRAVGRGQDGNADVVAFQMEIREAHLNIYPSLLMDSAIRDSVITRDTNGNAALNKSRHKGRIDGVQAAIQAVGMGRRWRLPTEDHEYKLSNHVV